MCHQSDYYRYFYPMQEGKRDEIIHLLDPEKDVWGARVEDMQVTNLLAAKVEALIEGES